MVRTRRLPHKQRLTEAKRGKGDSPVRTSLYTPARWAVRGATRVGEFSMFQAHAPQLLPPPPLRSEVRAGSLHLCSSAPAERRHEL